MLMIQYAVLIYWLSVEIGVPQAGIYSKDTYRNNNSTTERPFMAAVATYGVASGNLP